MNELLDGWKDVPGFDGYQAHPNGHLRKRQMLVRCHNGQRSVRGGPIKGHVMKSTGYHQIIVLGGKKHSAHRLIALTFCEGYAPGLVVNHKNGIRTDNRAENLEWVTQAENNKHAFRVLKRRPSSLGKFGKKHPTSKPIIMTNIKTGKEAYFDCALEAVKAIPGLDSGSISRCVHGKNASHKGHLFRFADKS